MVDNKLQPLFNAAGMVVGYLPVPGANLAAGAASIASNPNDPNSYLSGLVASNPKASSSPVVPAVLPIAISTLQQAGYLPTQQIAPYVAENGSAAPQTLQPATVTAQPIQPATPISTAAKTTTSTATPTSSLSSLQIVSPSLAGVKFSENPYGVQLSPKRSPIMDGTVTVGYTEQLSDGSQKIYYVVAGYPKPGFPKPGIYPRGTAIPRARVMGYNRRRPRGQKKTSKQHGRKTHVAKKQHKLVSGWMKKKIRF